MLGTGEGPGCLTLAMPFNERLPRYTGAKTFVAIYLCCYDPCSYLSSSLNHWWRSFTLPAIIHGSGQVLFYDVISTKL
jgi:hypothetical protein